MSQPKSPVCVLEKPRETKTKMSSANTHAIAQAHGKLAALGRVRGPSL